MHSILIMEIPKPAETIDREVKVFGEDMDHDVIKAERGKLDQSWSRKKSQETKQWMYEGSGAKKGSADYLEAVAHAHFIDGKNNEAIRLLDESLRQDPKSYSALSMRSEVYQFLGELDKSIADADAAIELTDDYIPLHLQDRRTTTLADMGKWSIHADAYAYRARSHRIRGDFARAVEDYEKSLEVKPQCMATLEEAEDLLRRCPDPKIRNKTKADEYRRRLDEVKAEHGLR